jgi:dTDP-4-amino-4,6-dideoxygalactose transaminase
MDAEKRRFFISRYKKIFCRSNHIKMLDDGSETIYSYFPVIFDKEANLIRFMEIVNPFIRTRRYYFPSLSQGYIGDSKIERPVSLKISESVSSRILCLPVYVSYSNEVEIKLIELLSSAERSLN